ncbi:hypothetical protein CYJ99_04300 [Neisseria perflava]|jgi:hypothetical protein|uniref:Uncharacterized protein n=1 Tax=Neisseria perflava TaxID=33053 RepID=A0A9X7F8J7_NEIPE|nr:MULTISPECIES: hypothetical protein [Neisseria]OFR82733.1 hypothetical protein HMPREF2865_09450 [Neisseria sp. HMSC073G10]PLA50315.1 hypothetical protein CYJ99_04300 [Neisseria perflava]WOS98978.1 hypothetical protein CYJ98_004775 [Neisseria perflava]
MLKQSYLFNMYEKLQWCSDIELGISNFFPMTLDMNLENRKYLFQVGIEFVYRAIKCGLLESLIDLDFPSGELNSLEHEFSIIANIELTSFADNNEMSCQERDIWTTEMLEGTDKLKSICQDCCLIGYEEFDENDPRWEIFVQKIEKIFSEQNLPWNLEQPLFTVKYKR